MSQPAAPLDQAPFIAIWEITQACPLACRHCRASAQETPPPGELSTAEGRDLIDELAMMGTRILVFSGGDPLSRADLPELIRYAKAQGLRTGTIPAASSRLTREAVAGLREAGLDQLALSLDASTEAAHDAFRNVPGTFARTLAAAAWARLEHLPLQINTVLSAVNRDDVEGLIALVQRLGVVFWEVFFLVPVGRGSQVLSLTAQECEALFARLATLAREAPFTVKITEAPHYRRYLMQHGGLVMPPASAVSSRPHIGAAPMSINAGKGHLFVSSLGEVYPSGFLPLSAGNVRTQPLAELYQQAPLFRALRDPDQLKGRCGACEFNRVCGGSRSRAFAVTGDYLAEDPCCAYEPALARR